MKCMIISLISLRKINQNNVINKPHANVIKETKLNIEAEFYPFKTMGLKKQSRSKKSKTKMINQL